MGSIVSPRNFLADTKEQFRNNFHTIQQQQQQKVIQSYHKFSLNRIISQRPQL